ncbi:MAG: penicillin-binding protein 2 [Rhodospirillaceae bacterium]|nr:penicillin-binding protein 2 [Rhodospirillaceae bacterium]MBT3627415.1 penicillin-binding protein 2 [Rhodospirillaceae bacterium]MBT7292929.1 penicillin-binding protein 2 [Rhodospirillaceae bacterium]
MQGETSRTKLFTRRTVILGGAQTLLLAGLAGRMYQLQVLESSRYKTLADDNRINMQLLPPPRGRIFDRFGQPLAVNQLNYRLVIVPEQAGELEHSLAALSNLIPIETRDRERILREARRKRKFVPITVRENLTWEEVSRIEVNAPDLPGTMIDVGQTRHYLAGEEAAHIIGYVGAVSEKELEGDPVLALPGFRIGKNGAEKIFETALRGKAGSRQVEVNAFGRIIRELRRDEGQPGDDHILTIDMGLQEYANARISEESAAAVVIDVHSGELLAMASAPSFNPNSFTTGISQTEWNALMANTRFPLTNKAISGQYSPGSTFKMVVALAALDGGLMNPSHEVFCPGFTTLGNRRFHCWKRGGHGRMNMNSALAQSCDVYFYEVSKRVGVDGIAVMARRFGFGEKLGIELPAERKGLVPTRDWKLAVHGVPWQKGETLVIGIGQGFLLTTPLQLAVMTARIANGGIAVLPKLVRETQRSGQRLPDSRESFPSMGLSAAHLAIVQKGMTDVTNSQRGTAYRARIEEPGMAMAGKTGSVQVKRITKAERERGVRKNEDRPWKDRDHALFVGYAPVEAPRYAVSVVVEHGGGGSKAAAPIARDILREVQRRDPARRGPEENIVLDSAATV